MQNARRLALAGLLSLGLAGVAEAQTSPTSAWNDAVTWRNPLERSVDLDRAEAQKRARSGGYGPGQINTTYNGDVTYNEDNKYNGPVTSNQATTATNLTAINSTVKQEGPGTATVTFATGSTAWQTSQNATVSNAHSGAGTASNNVDPTNQ